MILVICFGNNLYLDEREIDNAVDSIITVLKKELPEEALCVNVISEILEETKERISCKKLYL